MFQVLLPSHEPHIRPTILMLVRALEREGVECRPSPLGWKTARALAKLVSLMGVRNLPFLPSSGPVFTQLNHPWRNAFYPYVFRHPLVTYSFDLWPDTWNDWQRVYELNRPRIAFISAKVPMAEMQRRVPGVDFRWLPEAVDPACFDPSLPLLLRPIDVLEIGRPFEAYHERIREPLAQAGYCHQHPTPAHVGGVPHADVVKAYSQSKIVVCFPRSITHPHLAGEVETSTFRYFECMSSKALMIGHCPQELIDILGFNPVVEANLDMPAKQLIKDMLPHIGDYQALIDRNYEALCQTWTVEHQAVRIRMALKQAGEACREQ